MEHKRSWVWNHFRVAESYDSKAVCGICKTELMYLNSIRTTLNHFKSKLPGAIASTAEARDQWMYLLPIVIVLQANLS